MRSENSKKGIAKIASFLIAIGPDMSGKILKLLPEDIIEQVSMSVANIAHLDLSTRNEIIAEFMEIHQGHQYLSQGGVNYARDMLENALGKRKADEIISRLMASLEEQPFSFAREMDSKILANVLRNEHSQTIALVLSHLEAEQASHILSMLTPEQQINTATKIALMEHVAPDTLKDLAQVLADKFSVHATKGSFSEVGGIKSLVNILNKADRATEKVILERMDADNPSLAEEIRKRLFVFEDIITLEDAAIQKVVQEVDKRDLALAVKGSNTEVQERIFQNISKRAGELLREEILYLGPIRLRDVEEAQQRIVAVIRQLDEEGSIIISRGGTDAIII